MTFEPMIGHQRQRNEFLPVAGPVAVFALLLWVANRGATELHGGRTP